MIVAVGGLILVQRRAPSVHRRQHNDVAGFIYSVLGVASAVLLGLMVVAVWQTWEEAEGTATEEANELSAIFWMAHALPRRGIWPISLVRCYRILAWDAATP